MSERLYRDFFLSASEVADQLGKEGMAPFQFIVTDTRARSEELCGTPHVILALAPGDDAALLFKRQLTPELRECYLSSSA